MFSLLTLLDDIAATLDDVAVMTKVAIKKTSALMSDDLAVNAGVVTGVKPNRELPIVKAIFLGSLYNKVYSIVWVLILLAIYPPVLNVILFIGGVYLSYEGAHKVWEKIFHKKTGAEEVVISEKELNKNTSQTLSESDKKNIKMMINKLSTKEITEIISYNNKISKKRIYEYCLKLKDEK